MANKYKIKKDQDIHSISIVLSGGIGSVNELLDLNQLDSYTPDLSQIEYLEYNEHTIENSTYLLEGNQNIASYCHNLDDQIQELENLLDSEA